MCMVCVCVSVFVCVCTHTQPMQWPVHYHLDLCCLMLCKIHLIKGIMVVGREATLTFEPNAPSHRPSAIPEEHGEQMMLLPPSVGFLRACANHQKVSFSSIFMFDISRTKFLSNHMLKIKDLSSKIVLFSFTRTIMQEWNLFPNMFANMVNNNSFKFCFGSKRIPLPSEWAQPPTISLILEKRVPTFAYRMRTVCFVLPSSCFQITCPLPFGLYPQMAKAGASLSRCCCCLERWAWKGSEVPHGSTNCTPGFLVRRFMANLSFKDQGLGSGASTSSYFSPESVNSRKKGKNWLQETERNWFLKSTKCHQLSSKA